MWNVQRVKNKYLEVMFCRNLFSHFWTKNRNFKNVSSVPQGGLEDKFFWPSTGAGAALLVPIVQPLILTRFFHKNIRRQLSDPIPAKRDRYKNMLHKNTAHQLRNFNPSRLPLSRWKLPSENNPQIFDTQKRAKNRTHVSNSAQLPCSTLHPGSTVDGVVAETPTKV